MHSRPNTRCLFWIAVAASFLPPQLVCTHTHAQAHTHTHTCAHTHARTITHARTHMRTHTRTHTHACARTHTHIHTRTHKHTHTQTHTHTRLCWLANMASSGSKAALRLLQPWSAHVCVCVCLHGRVGGGSAAAASVQVLRVAAMPVAWLDFP